MKNQPQPTPLQIELNDLNKFISDLIKQRNKLLDKFRRECQHLRLIELQTQTQPPRRMCLDCGAEEEGWGCGYHVLALSGDNGAIPHKRERELEKETTSVEEFSRHCQPGPQYLVGQSHVNFSGPGWRSYEQLTEIPE